MQKRMCFTGKGAAAKATPRYADPDPFDFTSENQGDEPLKIAGIKPTCLPYRKRAGEEFQLLQPVIKLPRVEVPRGIDNESPEIAITGLFPRSSNRESPLTPSPDIVPLNVSQGHPLTATGYPPASFQPAEVSEKEGERISPGSEAVDSGRGSSEDVTHGSGAAVETGRVSSDLGLASEDLSSSSRPPSTSEAVSDAYSVLFPPGLCDLVRLLCCFEPVRCLF